MRISWQKDLSPLPQQSSMVEWLQQQRGLTRLVCMCPRRKVPAVATCFAPLDKLLPDLAWWYVSNDDRVYASGVTPNVSKMITLTWLQRWQARTEHRVVYLLAFCSLQSALMTVPHFVMWFDDRSGLAGASSKMEHASSLSVDMFVNIARRPSALGTADIRVYIHPLADGEGCDCYWRENDAEVSAAMTMVLKNLEAVKVSE